MDRKKLSKGGISFIIMGAVMLIVFFITVRDLVYSQKINLPIRAYAILLLMILMALNKSTKANIEPMVRPCLLLF